MVLLVAAAAPAPHWAMTTMVLSSSIQPEELAAGIHRRSVKVQSNSKEWNEHNRGKSLYRVGCGGIVGQ